MAEEFKGVTGLAETARALQAIPKVIARRYLRKAAYPAISLVQADAKARAPVLKTPDGRRIPGALRDAIIVYRDRRPPGEYADRYYVLVKKIKLNRAQKKVLRVLSRAGRSITILGDPRYGKFIEFGWHDRAGVFHIHPFMRPAFEAQKGAVVDKFADGMRTSLPDIVNDARSE